MNEDMQALASLYQSEIRSLAASVRNDRCLEAPTVTATKRSTVCGSFVTIDLLMVGPRIEAIGYQARACTLGMAATAILAKNAPGCTIDDISKIAEELRAILAGEKAAYKQSRTTRSGWASLEYFISARPYPSRHSSILLPFEAIAEARKTQRP